MTTASSSTVTMTLTLRGVNRTHSISFDCTNLEALTPEQLQIRRSKIYRAIDRWLNLSRRFQNVAP
jgi:hypothetical protein